MLKVTRNCFQNQVLLEKRKISQWFAVFLKRILHIARSSSVKCADVASFHLVKWDSGTFFFKSLMRQNCKCKVKRKVEFNTLLSSLTSFHCKKLYLSPYIASVHHWILSKENFIIKKDWNRGCGEISRKPFKKYLLFIVNFIFLSFWRCHIKNSRLK